jgi:septum site-determining protein MinD
VLIDCPAGLARDVGHQLACADAAVLVTTPKRPALWSALRTRKVANKVDTPVAAVVVNRVRSADDGTIAERVEHKFGTRTFTVPRVDDVQETQASGEPLEVSVPDSEALESFEEVATAVQQCESQLSDRAQPS